MNVTERLLERLLTDALAAASLPPSTVSHRQDGDVIGVYAIVGGGRHRWQANLWLGDGQLHFGALFPSSAAPAASTGPAGRVCLDLGDPALQEQLVTNLRAWDKWMRS